ncbi:MAG: TetR/AcrR family transcriptional regulator [Christensenella sp.]|uniref:TetR/AcrR family transcriptional regulator n=1 Tax=Christensenella sp. TaxID=1935934 RepID=UPI002B1EECEC|nr:TetR/AcrR family transcriptional regulator [Christensenella sp.]MEA5004278.1 TetR/AcrR family transcriptional regulator [Christensenella sp.]
MEKRDTKQLILQEALSLFSVRGYDGVSVKDIANAVGIKDSSLYKHYKSKQEIFAVLLEEMNRRFERTVAFYKLPQGEIDQVYRQYGENDLEWLKKAVEAMFLFFLDDPYANQFIHLLMIEQYKNNEAAKLFEEWMIDGALGFQTALFERMMQEGFFRKADPQVTALQFYGPIFLLLLMYDSKPERHKEALRMLDCHVEEFASNYHISHGENK